MNLTKDVNIQEFDSWFTYWFQYQHQPNQKIQDWLVRLIKLEAEKKILANGKINEKWLKKDNVFINEHKTQCC